jgi:integrase
VFTGPRGGPLAATTVEAAQRRECDRLGLRRVSPHGLRHLHASLLLAEGLPIPAVSARMGHANSAITMSVYAHVIDQGDTAATEAIGRALRRAAGE